MALSGLAFLDQDGKVPASALPEAAQGLQGIQGIQGIKGDKGDPGEQGIRGIPGANGSDGQDGTNGTNGQQGIQGIQGIQGLTGPTWQIGIGDLYFSTIAANPSVRLGYGIWSAFGAGRVLVGDGGGFVAGQTGGASTHTLTAAEMPSHTHTQDPHSHTIPVGATDDTAAPFDRADAGSNTAGANATTATGTATATNQATGGGGAHNNMQPYIVVYMWLRTA